jgi:succinate--hydroxymethylglutarate CoA-transferase
MSLLRGKLFPGASRTILCPNGSYYSLIGHQRRSFTAAGAGDGTLPLEGFKVLDMTRVLAGVSLLKLFVNRFALNTLQPYCTQILGDLGYEPVNE